MLLIDVGNSHVVFGIQGENGGRVCVRELFRLAPDARKTQDEYSLLIHALCERAGVGRASLRDAFISSVVPVLTKTVADAVAQISGVQPVVFGPWAYEHLPVRIPEPVRAEIGTDLVANAVAAYVHFRSACVVVDCGTALTFTAVDGTGLIQGVAIAPGLRTAVQSLHTGTAQLPLVPLALPDSVLGKDTTHAVQAGVVRGTLFVIRAMIAQCQKELGCRCAAVITGGLSRLFSSEVDFPPIDAQLTLSGLAHIARLVPTSILPPATVSGSSGN